MSSEPVPDPVAALSAAVAAISTEVDAAAAAGYDAALELALKLSRALDGLDLAAGLRRLARAAGAGDGFGDQLVARLAAAREELDALRRANATHAAEIEEAERDRAEAEAARRRLLAREEALKKPPTTADLRRSLLAIGQRSPAVAADPELEEAVAAWIASLTLPVGERLRVAIDEASDRLTIPRQRVDTPRVDVPPVDPSTTDTPKPRRKGSRS